MLTFYYYIWKGRKILTALAIEALVPILRIQKFLFNARHPGSLYFDAIMYTSDFSTFH